MNDNQKRLRQRALQAAEEALYKQQYVSPIDVFVGMKLLQPIHVDDWRKGRIPYLERVIQGSLGKITFCMKCFRAWAKEKGLKPSPTVYLARTSGSKRELRFSVSGNPEIEESYRTHYISPVLSEIKQKKLQEKLDKPPELVVFRTVQDSQCSQCKKELHKGSFLFMEAGQPLCLCCANLSELEYLPRGNAKLTRRVKKDSIKSTVVVEFSRSRKRYERQGILVEKESLRKARQELMIEDDDDDHK
jgi:hypothetical protein